MRAGPLLRLVLLMVGLTGAFGGLNLAARGLGGPAAVAAGAGTATVAAAAWLLARGGRGAKG